ncbi:MAG: kdgR 4 [Acidimicrobiaceae bacterium]|nr:kdgR 4 [Acidimicrobiaceae bacterium]
MPAKSWAVLEPPSDLRVGFSEAQSAPVDPDVDRRSVLGKVQLIVETLGADGQMGLSELARRTSIAKASVHRLCCDLVTWGVLERSGDSFRLGPRLFELGQRVPGRRSLCDAALPFMEDVYVATLQTVHLAVLEGTEVMYAEKIVGRKSVAVPSQVGGRLPLHCTATGKCMLAFGPAELLRKTIASGLGARTARSIVSVERLEEELAAVRVRGYATEHEEAHVGFASVAAPLFGGRGHVVAALAITTSVSELRLAECVPAIQAASRGLSRRLGARYPSAPGEPQALVAAEEAAGSSAA